MVSISAPKVGNSSTVNDIRTLVLVGKTGNGKSATGNSILGKGTFSLSRGKKSVAEKSVARTNDLVKGQTIEVIDTPGVMDTSSEYKTIGNEILNSINLATNGIHALLIVLSVRNRFSEAEETAVYYLLDLFGINILKYAILVFTGGDDLDKEHEEDDLVTNVQGDRLTDYLRGNCPDSLKEICRLCSNRMVLFDNKTNDKTKNSNQVHKLLSLIDEVQVENGGEPYTKKNCGKDVTMRLQGKEVVIGGDSSFLKAKFQKSYEEQLNQITAENDSKLKEIKRLQDKNSAQEVAKLKEKKEALTNEIKKNKEMLESSIARERAIEDIKKLVLIGKTGSGKTATGNSIIGKPELLPSLSKKSDAKNGVTSGCYRVQGESIEIVDTPGRLFETSLAHKSVANEFLNSIDTENTGIHAVLIVLSLKTKLYEAERAFVYALQVLFGKQICNYMIVVLTGGDSLNKEAYNEIVEDEVLDNHLRLNHSKSLEDILTLCGNRKVLFDNKTTDESKKSNQVKKLLSLVHKLLAENGGEPYTYKKREEKASISSRQKEFELPEIGELKYESIPKILKESDEIRMTNEKGMKDMQNPTAREKELNASMKDQGLEDGFHGESSRSKGKIQKPQEELTAAKQSARKFQLTPKMESKLSKTQSKPQRETSAQQELTGAKQSTPEQIISYIEIPKGSTLEMPNVGSKTVEFVQETGNAQSESSNIEVGKEAFVSSLSMTRDAKTVVDETNDHIEVPPINLMDTPDQVPKLLPLINEVLAENGGDPATQELAQKIQKPHEELTAAKQLATPKMESKLSETQTKPQGETSAQQELTAAKQPIPEQIKSYIEIPKGSTLETIELVREAGNAQSETSNNAVGKEAFVPSLSMTSDAKTVVAQTNDHIQVPHSNLMNTPDHGRDPAREEELAEKDVIPKLQGYAVGVPGESSETNRKIEKLYEDPKESELPETGEVKYESIPKILKELDEIDMANKKGTKDKQNRTAREKQLRRDLKREMRGLSKMGKQPKCCIL